MRSSGHEVADDQLGWLLGEQAAVEPDADIPQGGGQEVPVACLRQWIYRAHRMGSDAQTPSRSAPTAGGPVLLPVRARSKSLSGAEAAGEFAAGRPHLAGFRIWRRCPSRVQVPLSRFWSRALPKTFSPVAPDRLLYWSLAAVVPLSRFQSFRFWSRGLLPSRALWRMFSARPDCHG